MRLDVRADVRQAERMLRDVRGTVVQQAAASALNRAASQSRTAALAEASQALGVPRKALGRKVRFDRRDKATRKLLIAYLFVAKGALRVFDLGKARQTRKGVRVGRRSYPGAFISTMPSGHTGVFERQTSARLPIHEKVIEIRETLEIAIATALNTVGMRVFRERFDHELDRRLRARGYR